MPTIETLFLKNLNDLKSVIQDADDKFICPICLKEFTSKDIGRDILSIGDVWPEYLRGKSKIAAQQKVLLCKRCNSTAGNHGDKQMQLLERVKDGEKTGKLYDERRIEIIQTPDQEPIELNAGIIKTGELKFRLTFLKDKKRKQWARNNPKAQGRFLQLASQMEGFSVIVHPPRELHSSLARTGWLTSAYLFAFYTFGYRYIFNEEIQPVRDHILASFNDDPENLAFPKSDVISVTTCQTHNFNDPRIELDMPTSGNQPVHVEVSFLNYHVELPFHGVFEALVDVIHLQMPDFEERLPELAKQGISLRTLISCTKLDEHDCMWDYVMGKPIPTS